jgi:hypothetical protein
MRAGAGRAPSPCAGAAAPTGYSTAPRINQLAPRTRTHLLYGGPGPRRCPVGPSIPKSCGARALMSRVRTKDGGGGRRPPTSFRTRLCLRWWRRRIPARDRRVRAWSFGPIRAAAQSCLQLGWRWWYRASSRYGCTVRLYRLSFDGLALFNGGAKSSLLKLMSSTSTTRHVAIVTETLSGGKFP